MTTWGAIHNVSLELNTLTATVNSLSTTVHSLSTTVNSLSTTVNSLSTTVNSFTTTVNRLSTIVKRVFRRMDVLEEGHKVLATTISASGHYPSAVKVLGNNSGATALPDPDVEGSPSRIAKSD